MHSHCLQVVWDDAEGSWTTGKALTSQPSLWLSLTAVGLTSRSDQFGFLDFMVVFMSLHLLVLGRRRRVAAARGWCSVLSVSPFSDGKLLLYESSDADSPFPSEMLLGMSWEGRRRVVKAVL